MNLNYKVQKKLIIFLFLLTPIALLCAFSLYPAVYLVYLSFISWDGLLSDKVWAGFYNYKQVFSNAEIFQVFSHNLAYLVLGFFQNVTALIFAVILNSKIRGRNFYRVILFLPYILNGVAVTFMFGYVFNTEFGSLNSFLGFIGLEKLSETSWLGTPGLVNYTLASIGFWKYMGFNLVIYLAALQSVPSEIIEAAKIDGANRWRVVWNITLPNIFRIVELSMFLLIIGALEAFDYPFILTKGGPLGASETFVTKTVDTAFKFSDFGLASAMSCTLILIVSSIIIIQRLIMRRWDQ